jgi:hypothetical protein
MEAESRRKLHRPAVKVKTEKAENKEQEEQNG